MAMNEYDDGRIWFKRKGGVVTIGLTEKALEEIGSVQGINLPVDGENCEIDDVVAEIEGDQSTFELISPLAGMIEVVNEALNDDFERLEKDPLDEGWIYKIRIPKDEESEEDGEEE